MATEQQTSGTTEQTSGTTEQHFPTLIVEAKEIITHQFCDETNRYTFEITDYLFDDVIISLTPAMIKDMYLYMQKEEANQRWFKHIQNYQ